MRTLPALARRRDRKLQARAGAPSVCREIETSRREIEITSGTALMRFSKPFGRGSAVA